MENLIDDLMSMPVVESKFLSKIRKLISDEMKKLDMIQAMDLAAKAKIPYQHAILICYGISNQVELPLSSVIKALEATTGLSLLINIESNNVKLH